MSALTLFPDTNFFIQCLPIDQLDWGALGNFREINLIVSRPVQAEIDNQKNKGGNRVARKARSASSMFREVILSEQGYREFTKAHTKIRLSIRPDLKPDIVLSDRLNYTERDDQLVGIVSTFKKLNVTTDVRLLTNDTGPMASAKMVGVEISPIPNEWLAPPEKSETDRRIEALEADVARLRKSEPKFDIECLDSNGTCVSELTLEVSRYKPLSETEVFSLLDILHEKFPMAVEYGSDEEVERAPTSVGFKIPGMKEFFFPAGQEKIRLYQNHIYPGWLSSCQEFLCSLHSSLQLDVPWPRFRFAVANNGARPARDALVTLRSFGDFLIFPVPDEDNSEHSPKLVNLPPVPSAPKGQWKAGFDRGSVKLTELYREVEVIGESPTPMLGAGLDNLLTSPSLRPRDQNAFYYKPSRPLLPTTEIQFECVQWRHEIGEEVFEAEIQCADVFSRDSFNGSLKCSIHAENLSKVAELTVPVRVVVTLNSVYLHAEELVRALTSKAP